MELDEKIIRHAMDTYGISKDEAMKQIQELLDFGLLQKNDDPSMPFDFKLTTLGSKFAEKSIIKEFGEFKKVIDHNGIAYRIPTFVIIREGIAEQDLHRFPLWIDEK
jgi:hypothetical protein